MKLIMNKKVVNNDYIYEQFEEKGEQNNRIIDKVGLLSDKIRSKYDKSR